MQSNSENDVTNEIINCFEKSILNTFEFFYANSKSIPSVFNSEYDVQAFMFMQLFDLLKGKKLLFNTDGHLLFGINRKIKFEFKNICEKFQDKNWSAKNLIIDFFEKHEKIKLEKKIKQWEGVKNYWIEKFGIKDSKLFGIISLLSGNYFRSIDIGITNFDETLYDKNGNFIGPKKYLIGCEIKDSSTGVFKRNLSAIKKDIVKLNLLKITESCENAYMIFIDTINKNEFDQRKGNIFHIENGKFILDGSYKQLLESIKLYYLYIPEDAKKEEIQHGLVRKDISNMTIFSLKDMTSSVG